MPRSLLLLALLSVSPVAVRGASAPALVRSSRFVLAGERIRFDGSMHPLFSEVQSRRVSPAIREGLSLWSATRRGVEMIDLLSRDEYEIDVIEDATEPGAGRAPQPALPTLLASFDHSRHKSYTLVLNPTLFRLPEGMTAAPYGPSSAAELMAVSWAAETLHIYFYTQGISLPHHQRTDFQEEWRTIAAQLGLPGMAHDDADQMLRAAGANVRAQRWR